MNILYLDWKCYGRESTLETFRELGHTTFPFFHQDYQEEVSTSFHSEVIRFVESNSIDLCYSWNYFPVLAEACKDLGIPYVSFIYDNPYSYMYSFTLMYPTNFVFTFESSEFRRFRDGGLTNVFYKVLPGNPDHMASFFPESDSLHNPAMYKKTSCNLSFVGSLYQDEHDFLDRVTAKGNSYLNGYLEGLMAAQEMVYGANFIEDALTPKITQMMQDAVPYQSGNRSLQTPEQAYSRYFINRKLTAKERLHLLSKIGQVYPDQCKLFTTNSEIVIPGVNNMGVANYENEMVNVFHNSKINLNITLRSIFTGIPLRCIDIMSSGGFLLSNYQEDLCNAFIPGEEFVYYESAQDMLDKIGYYLDHSNERMQIAENGLNRIRKDYSFMQTFQDIFDIVFP